MKLLVKQELIEGKHNFRMASSTFSHMCGVSNLGWCKNCGIEASTGSLPKDSKCRYYKREYKEFFNGELDVLVSQNHIDKAIEKCKKDMIKTYKLLKKNNLLDNIDNRYLININFVF